MRSAAVSNASSPLPPRAAPRPPRRRPQAPQPPPVPRRSNASLPIDGTAANSWVKFNSGAGSPVVNAASPSSRFRLVQAGATLIGYEGCTEWGAITPSQASVVLDAHVRARPWRAGVWRGGERGRGEGLPPRPAPTQSLASARPCLRASP
jgi:hypothetical protein